MGALDGIKVLDIGRYIAAPFCAAMLRDLGADVIRVDRVDGGDDRFMIPLAEDGHGALFMQMNRGKRAMGLDLASEQGQDILRRLAAQSDVVVANLPPTALQKLGLDFATLQEIRPDIILTTVSAYGRGGPMSDNLGFDGVAQVMSGAAHLTGYPDEPMRMAVSWVDVCTASFATVGTLAALRHRDRTGEGQHVEGALLKSALTISNVQLAEQAVFKRDRVATGNTSQFSGPSDIVATSDGHIIVQANGMGLFKRWARLVGAEDLIGDERYDSDQKRGDRGPELTGRMKDWAASRSTEQALVELDEARVPAAPVLDLQGALDHPHIQALGFLQPMEFPGVEQPVPIAGLPFTMSADPDAGPKGRAPLLNEHTEEILVELGYDDDARARLHDEGVV